MSPKPTVVSVQNAQQTDITYCKEILESTTSCLTTQLSFGNFYSFAIMNQKHPTICVAKIMATNIVISILAPLFISNRLEICLSYLLCFNNLTSLSNLKSLTILCSLASLIILIHFICSTLLKPAIFFFPLVSTKNPIN